jgi:hypothetical protein
MLMLYMSLFTVGVLLYQQHVSSLLVLRVSSNGLSIPKPSPLESTSVVVAVAANTSDEVEQEVPTDSKVDLIDTATVISIPSEQPPTTTTNATNNEPQWTLYTVTSDERLRHQLRSDWPIIYQQIPHLHATTTTTTTSSDADASSSAANTTSICFVHVGKSAGSTISCRLGFLHGRCQDKTNPGQWIVPPAFHSPITRAVTHMIHNDYNDCIPRRKQTTKKKKRNTRDDENDDDDSSREDDEQELVPRPLEFRYYMFAIRDPIQRMISWFNYESPRNTRTSYRHYDKVKALYLDCQFDTFNELGEYIGTTEDLPNVTQILEMVDPQDHHLHRDDDDDDETVPRQPNQDSRPPVCRKRAILAITGRKRYVFHNYYNYGYYYHQVTHYSEQPRKKSHAEFWKSPKILVLRSEHLQDDWESIERGLLREGGFVGTIMQQDDHHSTTSSFFTTNPSPKRDDRDQYLSPKAMKNLCFWLCWEIQIYKKLIANAVNLNQRDKETSMRELAQSCPMEAASETSCYDDAALFETKKKKKDKKVDQRQDQEKKKKKIAKTKQADGNNGLR